jgi:hypothetical protein
VSNVILGVSYTMDEDGNVSSTPRVKESVVITPSEHELKIQRMKARAREYRNNK